MSKNTTEIDARSRRRAGVALVSFADARKIADAVLFEGYVLYPYRASSRKNQVRWQFGVLAPRAFCTAGSGEAWSMQTEVLVDGDGGARIAGQVRFLQVQARRVEAASDGDGRGFVAAERLEIDGRLHTAWEEAVERSVDFAVGLDELAGGAEREVPFTVAGGRDVELLNDAAGRTAGRLVRERRELAGRIRIALSPAGTDRLARLRVCVDNETPFDPAAAASAAREGGGDRAGEVTRDQALPSALVSAHTLLSVTGGAFLSLLDPPDRARAAAAACKNLRCWPVLVGEPGSSDVVLASPIILYDHPQVAPESPGDLYDATEIDEILTLRTLALTDDEKREARATDERAAAIVDRVDTMSPEVLERLHGVVRALRPSPSPSPPAFPSLPPLPPGVPVWDPAADLSVSPGTDSLVIGGVAVARGSRVRIHPSRHADAQDMFLSGRLATVEGVYTDVDERRHVAVSMLDDPATELLRIQGRYYYFDPDEVEPIEETR